MGGATEEAATLKEQVTDVSRITGSSCLFVRAPDEENVLA